ncbi:MAG: murein biosynthesis integral membrane protein MurJ [Kiritimatiellae bacterium]|nr:murein biosynthesis integral membrane protein MurJ [Kiritimatiellia bacterium]
MDKKKTIRSAGTVGFFILLSRALGLVRDMAMAAFFGSSKTMDAFVVAFTIPNLFRSLFGEGALSSAFVPVFTETLEKQERAKVWRFANDMLSLLAVILAAIVTALILLVSLLKFCWPASERIIMIFDFTRIMLPYMFFICLAAFFSAMLNSLRRFFMPAATYAALNIVMLAVLFLVCPRLDPSGNARILAVSWGVILAGAIQWLMQIPALWRCGFRPKLSFNWRDERVRRVWRLMGAAALGMGITQINVLIDRLIATFIGEGSPSYLYYAERIVYFPLGIFGTALGTVLLPTFSAQMAQARPDLVRQTLNHSLRQLAFLVLPAAMGMLALAKPIIRVIYEHGGFSPQAADMTALALAIYAPGLIAFSVLKILIPVFYARQDMKTPVRVGIVCAGLGVLLKLVLMWPLRHAGIALATVIVSTIQAGALAVLIHRRFGSPGWNGIFNSALKIFAAAAVTAVFAALVMRAGEGFLVSQGMGVQPARLLALTAAIGLAVAVYGLAAVFLRCPELNEFRNALRRKSGEQKENGSQI